MNRPALDPAAMAANAMRNALWPVLLVAAVLFVHLSGWAAPPETMGTPPRVLLDATTLVLSAAVLALSAVLVFDALLFRLIASHPAEAAGAAAVDDLLLRMRLKPRPVRLRDVAERWAGTCALMRLQRGAVAVVVLLPVAGRFLHRVLP